jgi:hypothetical protein
MGDPVSEDLFVLAADTRDKNIPLTICPVDFRLTKPPSATAGDPKWLPVLYRTLAAKLKEYPEFGNIH